MNCTDLRNRLSDYADGHTTAAEGRMIAAHLATCDGCRAALESLQSLRTATAALPAAIAPSRDLWPGIVAELEDDPVSTSQRRPASRARQISLGRILRLVLPLAAAALLLFVAAPAFRPEAAAPATALGWEVAAVAGNPRLADRRLSGEGRLAVGEWLETDANARAKLTVGSIGEVVIAPNSRLRLVDASPTDHRLELARGRLSAFIWAPPRLFFVETPSAVAVDLGCAYTLDVDAAGGGELHVTSGFVALEHEGRESIVPAGVKCLTRVGAGPGTPFAADAAEELRVALERFDFDARVEKAVALRQILDHARAEDAVTLWHLLERVEVRERGQVFDRLAATQPVPDGVTRDGIVAGDAEMRRVWASALGLGWF